ncbi:MAG: hypothetical protein KC420_09305 [Myxococcales bacterium]|nr:hypothetical protein [Myxococcales bacterium]MCB9703514.1 hypothetical protein [Myxococcales bacterium]
MKLRALLPALALAAGLAAPMIADAACSDPTGLCVNSGSVKWKSDANLSPAQKKKEKKLRAGSSVLLDVTLDGGRATVFLDGRFAGVAPLSSFSIEPGSHEIQVRDGNRILAEGVVTFNNPGESVKLEIHH